MIQYSEVRGGKKEAERVDMRRGTLLTRNDRRIVTDRGRSLRNVAFANISKDARMRSIVVDCTSPWTD